MPTQELSGTTALVTSTSRGFGRASAIALSKYGAHVLGVARDRARLEKLHAHQGGTFNPVAADATRPVASAGRLLGRTPESSAAARRARPGPRGRRQMKNGSYRMSATMRYTLS